MIAQNILSDKEIVITEADFDRLSGLLDSPRYRSTQPSLLRALKRELDRGKVVAADAAPANVVTMHSRVRVRDPRLDESETYTLVYPQHADINAGKLSVLAPLGLALLGARVGETVSFEAPAGRRRLRIERVLYQPEAAGDFHL